jgi:orotate phosphoribosyltransferase-like protein
MKAQVKAKKLVMWYKVKDLYENQGLNKSQIAKELEIDRGTVHRYLSMDEKSFHQWISSPKHMPTNSTGITALSRMPWSEGPFCLPPRSKTA